MPPSNPPSDDVDRDALYSSDAIEPDDAHYELEPPDPDVLSSEQRMAAERIAAAARSIDADELLREDVRRLDIEVVDDWMRTLRFQFQIKHMLWATAFVALLVAVGNYSWWSSILLGVLITVGGMLTFLSWKEKEHEAVVAERRRQLYAKRDTPAGATADAAPSDATPAEAAQSPEPAAPRSPQPPLVQQLLSFCTPRELLVASIVAVVLLALVGSLLGVATMASCLGILALVGVAIQAVGVEMPRIVTLSWWLMLVLYILLSAILVLTGVS
jgi:hypothetical protein